jgi:hypothetical protein
MKKFGRISGLLLLILLSGNISLKAQRGMRRMMMDSTRMNRMERGFSMNQDICMNPMPDSLRMKGMRPGFGPFGMDRMGPGIFPGPGFDGMRGWMWSDHNMGRMWRDFGSGRMMDRMGRGMKPLPGEGNEIWRNVPGIRMFENLPGLTDKQKKDIGELRQKQQDEMMKFRDEMLSKMKALRESHLGKIMDLLTPEQKKWVEENSKNPPEK